MRERIHLRRAMVIVNPVAGQRDVAATLRRIEERLAATAITYDLRITRGEGDAKRWAEGAEGYDRVLVSGGDGTVMEALSGLVGRDVSLGQIPTGTANLLAQALGIPSGVDAALELALTGEAVPFDVGYLPDRDRYFAMIAGAGWDAQLIEDASRDLKNRFGFLAYVLTGLKNLLDLQRSFVTIETDGVERNFRAHTVMVLNIGELPNRRFGLGDHIVPHDGRLDVALIAPDSVLGMVRIALKLLRGRFESDGDLQYLTARHLRIEARPPLPVQIDGEPIGTTPLTIEAVPDAVRLVVPDSYLVRRKRVRGEEGSAG